jgi:site-specific DNA-methyltransferase (adenine-specific)
MTPYYADELVTLYLGDCREIVPALGLTADAIVTDPPYASTSLQWDRWPEGWLDLAAAVASSMWCFGSLRMFMERAADFAAAGWSLPSQDVASVDDGDVPADLLWEKHNGSGFQADRFRRVHETVAHFYRGPWSSVYREAVYVPGARKREVRTKSRPEHMGHITRTPYTTSDGGPKLATSIMRVRSEHGRAIHPTQKPLDVLVPLIRYACPLCGVVGDLFAGSGATLVAARACGRASWGIEADEKTCERAARRLAQINAFDGATA